MEFKGTKGEWYVIGSEPEEISTDKKSICLVSIQDYFNKDIEQRANAKLIAAAPDLLEELVTLLSNIDEMGNTGEDMMELRNYLSDARKAINKALN